MSGREPMQVLVDERELEALRAELELARWRAARIHRMFRGSLLGSIPVIGFATLLVHWYPAFSVIGVLGGCLGVYYFGVRPDLKELAGIMEATELPGAPPRSSHVSTAAAASAAVAAEAHAGGAARTRD